MARRGCCDSNSRTTAGNDERRGDGHLRGQPQFDKTTDRRFCGHDKATSCPLIDGATRRQTGGRPPRALLTNR